MKNKVLSIILAGLMLLSSLPVGRVVAEETPVPTETPAASEVTETAVPEEITEMKDPVIEVTSAEDEEEIETLPSESPEVSEAPAEPTAPAEPEVPAEEVKPTETPAVTEAPEETEAPFVSEEPAEEPEASVPAESEGPEAEELPVEETPEDLPAASEAKEPPLLGAPAANAEYTITILLKDLMLEKDLTAAEIGDGFDLVYYKFPANEVGFDVTTGSFTKPVPPPYPGSGTPVSPLDYMLGDYRRTTHISAQRSEYRLDMETIGDAGDPSPENPYVMLFFNMPYMYSGSSAEWNYIGALYYDGTDAYLCGTKNMTLSLEDHEFTLLVAHDDSMFYPKVTVHFDTEDYDREKAEDDPDVYPIVIGYNTDPEMKTTISRDGTYVLTSPYPLSRKMIEIQKENNPNYTSPVNFFYVPISTNDWTVTTGSPQVWTNSVPNGLQNQIVASDFGEDGTAYVKKADSSDELIPAEYTFTKKTVNGIRPSLLLRLTDEWGAADASDFPVYVRITVTDSWHSSWTSTKVVKIEQEDLESTLMIRMDDYNEYLGSEDYAGTQEYPFNFYFETFEDEGCTTPARGWADHGAFSLNYIYNRNYGKGEYVWCFYDSNEQGETVKYPFTLWYGKQHVEVPVHSFTNDTGSMYPAWVKVELNGETRVLEITGNEDKTIDFGKMIVNDLYYKDMTWSVYSDEECTTLHPLWGISGQSERVAWNGEELVDYDSYSPALINLTQLSTDVITVPMITDIGDLESSLFFPVYMTATLTCDDGFTPVTITKKLTSLEDANQVLVFHAQEGESFSSNANNTRVEVRFFTDDALTNKAPRWSDAWENERSGGALYGTLWADGKLHSGISELKIIYKPVSVDVKPDTYKVNPTEEKPLNVHTWLAGYNGLDAGRSGEDDRRITSEDQFTVTFPHLGYVGEKYPSVVAYMNEDGRGPYDITSQDTRFTYTIKNDVSVGADGHLETRGYGGQPEKTVLRITETPNTYARLTVPVHVNIPDEPYYFSYERYYNGIETAYLSLRQRNAYSGEFSDYSFVSGNDNYNTDTYYYAYCYRDLSELDEDMRGTITVRINGSNSDIYYLNYGLGHRSSYNSYAYNGDYDEGWTNEQFVKVRIKTVDGKQTLVYADTEEPVVLEIYWKHRVQPQIDVLAEYPEGYDPELNKYEETELTPEYMRFTLRGPDDSGYSVTRNVYLRSNAFDSEGKQIPLVPAGNSLISSRSRHTRYIEYLKRKFVLDQPDDYDGPPIVGNIDQGTLSGGNYYYVELGGTYYTSYDDAHILGLHVGDYELTYATGDSTAVKEKWESADKVRVHLAEDGKIYEIKDDGSYAEEPYVIHIRYIGDTQLKKHESLKTKVETTVKDGVDPGKAFTEGDVFAASVTEWRYRDGSWQPTRDLAVGTASITEAGTADLELTSPDGGMITLHDDAMYTMSYGTFHEFNGTFSTEHVNRSWLYYDTNWYTSQESGMEYPITFIASNVAEDGSVMGWTYQKDDAYWGNAIRRSNDADGEILTFFNSSLILPWQGTDPGAIAQTEEDIVYKPISDITAFKEKANYIIVAQNRYNKKWYALYYDEKGGNAIELSDVTSLEDLEDGYKPGTSADYQKMIFSASKVVQGSDSVSLQLRTAYKDENGKMISLKMGQSSDDPAPLLSGSAGTVIIRSAGEKRFTVSKGNYANLWYVEELFGWSGFRTVSNKFGPWFTRGDELYGLLNTRNNTLEQHNRQVSSTTGIPFGYEAYSVYAGISDAYYYPNKYQVDVAEKYLNNSQYLNKLRTIDPQFPGSGFDKFYILSDDVQEDIPPEQTNKYTLVRTAGDFVRTFIQTDNGSAASDMILVYEVDGKEYAMEAGKLYEVVTKAGSSGYRTLTTIADHELIPDNNSGTSAHFSLDLTEIKDEGIYVFATGFAFRKSRQNNTEDRNYMTLSGETGSSAWTKNDDKIHAEGLVYILHPSDPIHSQADWDTPESYKLSVIRDGQTHWLGVAEDENGDLQMVVVDSEEEAVRFKVYTDELKRYYSSVYGTDLYRYYKVTSITDINAGDEILIVYNDNGTKRIIGRPFTDYGTKYLNNSGYYYSGITPAAEVLEEYSTIDTRGDAIDSDTKYSYRLGTEEYVKKPYAYIDPEDDSIIWAQGISANAIGNAKSETGKQRKYESVMSLGGGNYVYIKSGSLDAYYNKKAETNFFPGENEGEFFIRGGKSDAWLGTVNYKRNLLNIETGRYEYTDEYLSFGTVSTDNRIAVEIYRRPASDETFTVKYHTAEGEDDHSEVKPKDTFTLTQKKDLEKDGVKYVFVGWTTDYDNSGYLSLADSANLYDYDDLAKLASIKRDVQKKYGLLGDCNPEIGNLIDYGEVEDKVVDDVLSVYPVYAVRGYSAAVTADDPNRMIIGASDFKDLQNGNSGATDEKERWLGSINIEVYKDGELWVPGGDGGSTTGRKKLSAPKPAKSATLYFAYHNDDAADLNIKFIADGITAETLYEYMSSNDFSQAEPSEQYVIDAVYAEQGGSEDGLRYRLNWLDPVVGGQLDNVRGGSTVKVYVTTKYQVKYYMDSDDGKGYVELADEIYQDEGSYTTPGTDDAIAANEAEAAYVVEDDDENLYHDLVRKTPSDGSRFIDENIKRGDYSKFLYKFNSYDHTFQVPKLPDPPKGYELESDAWTIRDQDLKELTAQQPSSDFTLTGTKYGTGNTVYAYKGETLGDITNTFHLYIRVRKNTIDIPVTKVWEDAEDEAKLRPASISVVLLADGEETEKTLILSERNEWKGVFEDLEKDHEYTIKELEVENYTSETEGDAEKGFTITNTLTEKETIDIPVTKVWEDADDAAKLRPLSISVVLLADGEETDQVLTLNQRNEWKGVFEDLEKDHEYTIKELEVENYSSETEGDAEKGFTITNTLIRSSLTLAKTLTRYESSSPVTFVFSVKGENDGREVYNDVVSLTFSKTGTETVILQDLPLGEYTVTEIYSGASYRIEGEAEKKITLTTKGDDTVSFSNSYNDKPKKSYGADNRFTNTDGKWEWTQRTAEEEK
ncbi:MAG: Cna B-type domain-containing protein [Erysipelotrichaceae bacterium]|nr:Cna B-type domain-containing protein [Erysipelotrichaceae bacterium]